MGNGELRGGDGVRIYCEGTEGGGYWGTFENRDLCVYLMIYNIKKENRMHISRKCERLCAKYYQQLQFPSLTE